MNLSPKQIVTELDKYIIGQKGAKKAVAIALRNRYRRSRLTQEEMAVIAAIKAQNKTEEEKSAPSSNAPSADDIQLSEQTKQQAFAEPAAETESSLEALERAEELPAEETEEEAETKTQKCLLVAFVDIDIAFNEHPRTQAVKKQIDLKIKSKQREVENAKDIIAALEAENKLLSRQMSELKPFYEKIVTDQVLLPKVPEPADTLLLNNTLNRLIFSGTEVLSTSPLNSPARLDDLTERIGANKKIIAERSFFIDNYKYQTREEILTLEQQEVKAILQDIYNEIKSFAKKRNIGAVVRKDEILYGQEPVNVTKDFVNRLKKSKKYRKK